MAVQSSPANIVHVNHVVQSDSNDLSAFIVGLRDMPVKRPNWDEIIPKLEAVIERFATVAQAYLEKARELLGDEPAQPRLQKYERVLRKVENHALKLSELVRPDPDKQFFPASRRQLLYSLISIIARRANVTERSPFIMPVLGDSFKYVNVNYVNGFGLLCLPPRTVTTLASNRNLSILWHEAAGYAIATAKREQPDRLEKWAYNLQGQLKDNDNDLWQRYRELYRESLLSNLNGRNIFSKNDALQDIENLIRERVLSPAKVDNDSSWQVTFLSEFLEDLYWIMVGKDNHDGPNNLADDVITVMAGALAATYENLSVGDPDHPSPHLRVLVAMNYLCNEDQKCVDQRIEAFVGDGEDIFGLQTELDREVAGVIASVCREILDEQATDRWLYQTGVTDLEKEIAYNILNGQPLSGLNLPNLAQENISPDNPDNNPDNNPEFINRINNVQDLDELLAIEFTTDDPFPQGGGTGWPPPWP